MEFNSRYAKPNGEVVRGVQVGQTAEEVRNRLREQGFLPLSVQPKVWSLRSGSRKKEAGFKPDDFVVFNQQFVALIRAGLPILRSHSTFPRPSRTGHSPHRLPGIRPRCDPPTSKYSRVPTHRPRTSPRRPRTPGSLHSSQVDRRRLDRVGATRPLTAKTRLRQPSSTRRNFCYLELVDQPAIGRLQHQGKSDVPNRQAIRKRDIYTDPQARK